MSVVQAIDVLYMILDDYEKDRARELEEIAAADD